MKKSHAIQRYYWGFAKAVNILITSYKPLTLSSVFSVPLAPKSATPDTSKMQHLFWGMHEFMHPSAGVLQWVCALPLLSATQETHPVALGVWQGLGPTALWSGELGVQAILPLAYQQGVPVSGAERSTVRLYFTFFHFLLIKYLHKGDYFVPFDCGASCVDSIHIRGWWRGKEGQQSSVIATPVPAFLISKWKRSSHPYFCIEVPPPLSALHNVNAS